MHIAQTNQWIMAFQPRCLFKWSKLTSFTHWEEPVITSKRLVILSFLRDIEDQKVFLPRFCSNKLEYLNLTTEKTVEIFQSKWRNYGNKQDDGNSFARFASAIASCGFLTTCKEYWMCLLLKKIKKKTNKQKLKKRVRHAKLLCHTWLHANGG